MTLLRLPGAAAGAVLALAVLPAAAQAHDGAHPYANCSQAYAHGDSHIPQDDPHFGPHLDRDGDGVGCDRPPAGFVPRSAKGSGQGAGTDTGTGADSGGGSARDGGSAAQGADLAETGAGDGTPWIAAGGMSVLLAGTAVTVFLNRRRGTR